MKNKNILVLSFLALVSLSGCKNNDNIELKFTQREYELKTGEKIEVEGSYKDVKYQIINNPFESISLDADSGTFTFDDTIPNYTQVMAVATYKEFVSEPCVVTLTYDYQVSDVHFTNMSTYIVNNEYVNAVSSKNYSVMYSLKEEVAGISIESETGKVSFAPIVKDGTKFTVVANSHGSTKEQEFSAMTEGFVEALTYRQALEKDNEIVSAFYPLDFSKSTSTEGKVIALVDSLNNLVASEHYSYDEVNKKLEIKASILSSLNVGVNNFKIITERNSVAITLDVITKFINTVDDLVSINNSMESLAGYYILMNDLDLSDYLNNEGYNEGKGWTPIGLYTDTLDTTIATQYSFKGTFDGNGHVIRGLYANRKDTASFNAGLFGYITSTATIRNLGVEGELTVSSYSGGLVGSNNGLIENCWANVNMEVSSGENAYRYVGGLVGNNFGTVRNCYAIGNVSCDTYFGSLIGSNTGFVENSYSFKTETCEKIVGYGSIDKSCIQFENVEEMKAYDFSNSFSDTDWEFSNDNLPTLKEILVEYNLRAININVENKKYFKGDIIPFSIDIYPKSLEEEYLPYVSFKVNGEGYVKLGNSIYTKDATSDSVTLEASLTYNGQTLIDTKVLYAYDKVESLEIKHDLEYLEAGKRYLLNAECTPSSSVHDQVTYHLSTRFMGAEIIDNILHISDEFTLDSISFYALSESGVKSSVVTIPVKTQKVVPSGVVTLYENENNNLEFEFDSNLEGKEIKVSVFNKEINYQIDNNKIIVSRELLEDTKDMKARFIFNIDEEVYGIDAYYFSHVRYTLDSINEKEVIKINSIEDYFKYFNADPNEEYSEEKTNNYDKTFVLTNDLDFNGKEIYAIGYGEKSFTGKFYGLGHSISNFKIKNNEKIRVEDSISCYYGVGLFAKLDGEIYDLTIKDASISARNFVGGFVGMLTDGYLENCQAFNLKVLASEYEYSSEDVKVGKIVGKQFSGQVICSYYNNSSLNTIG